MNFVHILSFSLKLLNAECFSLFNGMLPHKVKGNSE